MKIDHIGYAVKDIVRSIEEFEKLGFKFDRIIDDEKRNIQICFGELEQYRIELVTPMKNGKPSPVDMYVKEYGNIPYHICYQTIDIMKEISELTSKGYKVIVSPDKACALNNHRVAFLMNLRVGIIELVEIEMN